MKQSTAPALLFLKRYRWLFIGIAGGLIVFCSYFLYSLYEWGQYESRYKDWRASIKSQTDQAFALSSSDPKARAAKLAALKKISDRLATTRSTACQVNRLIEWQHILKSLEDRQDQCNQVAHSLDNFKKSLDQINSYLTEENALGSIFAALPPAKDQLAEDEWQAYGTAWHSAAENATKLSTQGAFMQTRQVAVSTLQGIDAAWQEVLAAHAAKDKARYTKAEAALIQAYSSLESIKSTSEVQLDALVKSLQNFYKIAFL